MRRLMMLNQTHASGKRTTNAARLSYLRYHSKARERWAATQIYTVISMASYDLCYSFLTNAEKEAGKCTHLEFEVVICLF